MDIRIDRRGRNNTLWKMGSKGCRCGKCRGALVFFLLEIISLILDQFGGPQLGFLLAQFLLSVVTLGIAIYKACNSRRTKIRSLAQKQLIVVEIVFTCAQFIISSYCLILKANYRTWGFPLLYSLIDVGFAFTNNNDDDSNLPLVRTDSLETTPIMLGVQEDSSEPLEICIIPINDTDEFHDVEEDAHASLVISPDIPTVDFVPPTSQAIEKQVLHNRSRSTQSDNSQNTETPRIDSVPISHGEETHRLPNKLHRRRAIPPVKENMNSPNGDTTYTKVYVRGLALRTKRDTMMLYFKQFGEILKADIILDKISRRSRGFGFVTFRESEAASKAVDATPVIDGRRVQCKLAPLGVKCRPSHGRSRRASRATPRS